MRVIIKREQNQKIPVSSMLNSIYKGLIIPIENKFSYCFTIINRRYSIISVLFMSIFCDTKP